MTPSLPSLQSEALDQARADYRSAHDRLKDQTLTGLQRGMLKHDLTKKREALKTAYATSVPTRVETANPRSPQGEQPKPTEAVVVSLRPVSISVPASKSEQEEQEDPREVSFDFYCVPTSEAMKQVTAAAWMEWEALMRRQWKRNPCGEDLDGYRAVLDTTVANMAYAIMTGNDSGVYVTRMVGIVSKLSRYRPPIFNRKFLTVLDGLVDIGWLHQTKGEQDKTKANPFTGRRTHSDRTVIRGTKALRKAMNTFDVKDVREVAMERDGQEVCLLKDGEPTLHGTALDAGELLEYQDTAITIKYRQDLRIVNALLQNADLTVVNKEGLRFIDDRQRFQQRQFTYGSFESGGRLKGGFWYSMTKAERFDRIRINGEDVVELDYHGMLPHLLYGKVGLHAPVGDPYAVPGLMMGSRGGIKKLFAALAFDRTLSRSKFPKGVSVHFTDADQQKGCKAVIQLILDHHKAIAHLFGKGLGHHLQWQESQLMVSLLIRVREWGYIGLPVHDCLIVPRSQAFDVQTLMENVAEDVTRIAVPVRKKTAQSTE